MCVHVCVCMLVTIVVLFQQGSFLFFYICNMRKQWFRLYTIRIRIKKRGALFLPGVYSARVHFLFFYICNMRKQWFAIHTIRTGDRKPRGFVLIGGLSSMHVRVLSSSLSSSSLHRLIIIVVVLCSCRMISAKGAFPVLSISTPY